MIHVERSAGIFRLAFGVGDRAPKHFLDIASGALLREP